MEPPAVVRRLRKVRLTFRARDLVAITAAAATCVVTACATATSGGPAAASLATVVAGTPTGAATAASATPVPLPIESSPRPAGSSTAGAVIPAGPLTQADDGKTVLLAVGQQVTVVLATPPRMWDQPAARGGAVTRVSASGGYPTATPARAVFRAVAPGTAQLTSAADMRCEHQIPRCLPPDEIWTVWVVVT